MSSELVGKYNKNKRLLELLEKEVYETSVSIITMVETAEACLESGKTEDVANYLKSISERIEYLKGYVP